MSDLVPVERIENKIYLIRGQKVMLDRDLAELYNVKTKALNQAVKRNSERFPEDFMFSLTREEILRMSQFVTSYSGSGKSDIKFSKNVNAFTEQGIAMLSSVLRSKRAVQVNIAIMRAFVKLRQILSGHKELRNKIETMEKKYDQQFRIIFDAIKALLEAPCKKAGKIGFLREKR